MSSLTYPLEIVERRAILSILLEDKYRLKRNHFLLPNSALNVPKDDLEKDITRLNAGIPIQQVVGFTYFMDLKFKVNDSVLIPRPETEELVSILINEFLPKDDANLSILDIGTGTGCIPISLKTAFPKSEVIGWEVSSDALKIASNNALWNNCKINFEKVDILNFKDKNTNRYDLIVSNPPYVMESEKQDMTDHVLNHEPHLALFVSDADPLLFYSKISSFAFDNLKENGLLAFEINSALGKETLGAVRNAGFKQIELRQDFFGKDRFIFAKK